MRKVPMNITLNAGVREKLREYTEVSGLSASAYIEILIKRDGGELSRHLHLVDTKMPEGEVMANA